MLVVAFVLLPSELGRTAGETLRQLRAAAGLQAKAKLKFSRLHGSAEGRIFLRTAVEYLDASKATLYVGLIEKRFALATMIVETFLDPHYNPHAPPENAPRLRQELANLLLEVLTTDMLSDFLLSVRNVDKDACRRFGELLTGVLVRHPVGHVRFVGQRIRAGLGDFFFFGDQVEGAPARLNRANPLVHSFLPLLHQVHRDLEQRDLRPHLVADEDAKFGPVLDHAFEVAQDEDRRAEMAEFGFEETLDRFESYRRASEDDEPAIVFADLLAGSVRHVVNLRLQDDEVSSEMAPIWHATHSCLLRSQGHCYVALSDLAWEKSMLSR